VSWRGSELIGRWRRRRPRSTSPSGLWCGPPISISPLEARLAGVSMCFREMGRPAPNPAPQPLQRRSCSTYLHDVEHAADAYGYVTKALIARLSRAHVDMSPATAPTSFLVINGELAHPDARICYSSTGSPRTIIGGLARSRGHHGDERQISRRRLATPRSLPHRLRRRGYPGG